MSHIVNPNKDSIMKQVNENENFCEIGKKACKLHLMGFSNEEIAIQLGEDEEKIADTIRKMEKVVTL